MKNQRFELQRLAQLIANGSTEAKNFVPSYELNNDDDIRRFISESAETIYHPVCVYGVTH